MNEHGLTKRLRAFFAQLKAEGVPIWARKIHGGMYQRDLCDWLVCLDGSFVAIETKSPARPTKATAGQKHTMREIVNARGEVLLSHDLDEIESWILRLCEARGVLPKSRYPY
jgi:hypothetical protein